MPSEQPTEEMQDEPVLNREACYFYAGALAGLARSGRVDDNGDLEVLVKASEQLRLLAREHFGD